jgi:hypothetical protein
MTLFQLYHALEVAKLALLETLKTLQMSKLQQWAEAIKVHEGWYPGSRSYRNNNPGNLRYTAYTSSLGAVGKDSASFCRFGSPALGMKALTRFLEDACTNQLKRYKGTMSLIQFYEVYAPSSENDSLAYANFIAQRLNIDPSKPIYELL